MQEVIQTNTPLHDAARLDDRPLAQQLIKRGADINAKDEQGNTPLAVAVGLDRGEKNLDLDKTLFWVSEGASPSSTNNAGESVWWKSTPAAQNLMVAEMQEMDRRLSLQEASSAATQEDMAPMRVPSPDSKPASHARSGTLVEAYDNDRWSWTERGM